MNIAVLIFWMAKNSKVHKADLASCTLRLYSSHQKYQHGNIDWGRGVGTFSDFYSTLGQLFPYNLKNLYAHFHRKFKTFKPF
jgi:hypothetical protein